jgi:hypothetical protein
LEDFSKAPPPEKRETVPERRMLVLGDAMADWLAYGLEDAYAEQPEMGVIRKHKTVSGLIKYQPKGDPADWPAAARGILATEKPDAIVVMLGLNDRTAIREPVVEKPDSKPSDKKSDKKDAKAKPEAKPGEAKSGAKPGGATDAAAKPENKAVDSELSPDDAADNNDAPPVTTPDKSARSPNGLYEFREERWVELYTRKIDEMIGVLKSKVCRCCGSACPQCAAPRRPQICCSWIRCIARPPARCCRDCGTGPKEAGPPRPPQGPQRGPRLPAGTAGPGRAGSRSGARLVRRCWRFPPDAGSSLRYCRPAGSRQLPFLAAGRWLRRCRSRRCADPEPIAPGGQASGPEPLHQPCSVRTS